MERPCGNTTWSYHGNTMLYTMVQIYHGILRGITITQKTCYATVSFLHCHSCRPMHFADMWRWFAVTGTRRTRTVIDKNIYLPSVLEFRLRAISHFCTASAMSLNFGMK